MKKILISLITISFLVAPLVGFAQFRFTYEECIIRHDLSDYEVCVRCVRFNPDGTCAEVEYLGPGSDTAYLISVEPGWGATLADCCLIDKILTIGDYIFVALLVVGIIMFLLAAWGFLTSAGEPDKVKKARSHLLYSVIGIGVAFLAKALVRVVAGIIG